MSWSYFAASNICRRYLFWYLMVSLVSGFMVSGIMVSFLMTSLNTVVFHSLHAFGVSLSGFYCRSLVLTKQRSGCSVYVY